LPRVAPGDLSPPAINLGGDADTTGADYGQIAGANYGAAGIPSRWLHLLTMREEIESLAHQVATTEERHFPPK